MGKYKQHEIELSPRLLHKIFEYVKANPSENCEYIIENLKWMAKTADEMLTLDEYELAVRKPVSM